jgi:predicted oxidoreductase
MRTIKLGKSLLDVPVIAVGCMRINKIDKKQAEAFVQSALDIGANFFDNADCYADGECEKIMAGALHISPSMREKIIVQTKCGITPVSFDFSKKHIIEAAEASLKRLHTDYIDVLLLHRPDMLVEPEEVAEAFDILHYQGKVKYFGVSNQHPMLISLLQKYVHFPIVANQMQFSIMHPFMASQVQHVNMLDDLAVDRDGSVLDFCRMNDITIQAWSPFQYGFFEGVFLDNEKFPKLNEKINEIAGKYGVTNTTIAVAWILRHPAKMQVVTGTMNIDRLKDCAKAAEVRLTREEWYEIYLAAGNILP